MTTFDPVDTSSQITLTNGNLTATKTGAVTGYASTWTDADNGAKIYLEARHSIRTDSGIGIANADPIFDDNWLGETASSVGLWSYEIYRNGAVVAAFSPAQAVNDWVGVAIDTAAQTIQFRNITKSGTWSSPLSIASLGAGPFYFGATLSLGDNTTANFSTTFVSMSTPSSGYTRWDGSPLIINTPMTAARGTLVAAGQVATLRRTRKMPAVNGTLTTAGQPATLRRARKLLALNGVLTAAGYPTTLRLTHKLPAVNGVLSSTGRAAALRLGRRLPAVAGTLTLTGYMAGLVTTGSYQITANPGALTLTGRAAGVKSAHRLLSTQGAILLTGKAASLVYTPAITESYTLIAAPSVLALSGRSAELHIDRVLPPYVVQTETLNFGRTKRALLGPWRAD